MNYSRASITKTIIPLVTIPCSCSIFNLPINSFYPRCISVCMQLQSRSHVLCSNNNTDATSPSVVSTLKGTQHNTVFQTSCKTCQNRQFLAKDLSNYLVITTTLSTKRTASLLLSTNYTCATLTFAPHEV